MGREERMKPLLKPAEAARMLGVSRSQIYHLAATGEIAHVRVGHSVRFRLEDLERYIERRRVAAAWEEEPPGSLRGGGGCEAG
ncbi:MAG: hypothetical protein KatS3mg013_1217 [Actinomycetota bacterium]|nr:MAG: hypothetical protein KatS3mg013_1217 [Actinomycetota bacterium]